MGFVTLPSGEVVHASALGNAGRVIFGRIVAIDRRTGHATETGLVTVEVAQSMVDGLMICQKCDLLLPPPTGSAMPQQVVSSVEGATSAQESTSPQAKSIALYACRDLGPWEVDELLVLGTVTRQGCLSAQGIFDKYSVTERDGKWIITCNHDDYDRRWEFPASFESCEKALKSANTHNQLAYEGIIEKWRAV